MFLEDTIQVQAGGQARGYTIRVRPGIRRALPQMIPAHAKAHRYAVIADERVAELYGAAIVEGLTREGREAHLFTFPPGEGSKTREEWARLTGDMLKAGFGRDSAVVAVGGGVTGDLAGFVAATFMRGVPLIQVPTSLVAMIDSSVGGKSGVDVPEGKNLVGAFHPPHLVVVDPEVAVTLPREERAQGLAEAVKHGAILDPVYLADLEGDIPCVMNGEVGATGRVVVRSIEIKAEVVSKDERESGLRKVLNFGHTLGHAIESAGRLRPAPRQLRGPRDDPGGPPRGADGGHPDRARPTVLRKMASLLELPTRLPPDLDPEDGSGLHPVGQEGAGRDGPGTSFSPRPGKVAPGQDWAQEVPDEIVLEVLEGRSRSDGGGFGSPKSFGPYGFTGILSGFDASRSAILAFMVFSERLRMEAPWRSLSASKECPSPHPWPTGPPGIRGGPFLLHQDQLDHLWPGRDPVRCHGGLFQFPRDRGRGPGRPHPSSLSGVRDRPLRRREAGCGGGPPQPPSHQA